MNLTNNKKGQAALMMTVVLTFIMMSYSLILTESSIHKIMSNKMIQNRMQALWMAEAGIQKAIWCMNQLVGTNCGGTFGENYTGETVFFEGGEFDISISGAGEERDVVSTGTYLNGVKSIKVKLEKTGSKTAVTFQYSAMVGQDGIELKNGSFVRGDLYANSNIVCKNASFIWGNLVVTGDHEVSDCIVIGDVKSHTIKSSIIFGDAYYQTISSSIVTGESYPGSEDIPEISSPITPEMIASFKLQAEKGGIFTGNKILTGISSIGPLKIDGNLEIALGAIVTLTGSLYITGGINIVSDSQIVLDSGFEENSAFILSDGQITAGADLDFTGTVDGGYITLITLDSGNAIDFGTYSRGDHDIALYAPNGIIKIHNHSTIFHASGARVILQNSSMIDYDSRVMYTLYVDDITATSIWGVALGSRIE